MSRYIDADAYERELRTSNIISHYGEQIIDKIYSAPSIDIVRCRECKYWNTKYFEDGYGWCRHHINETTTDDFCSYGQKERASDDEY